MVYRKTSKGQAEIDTRAFRLAPRLRGLLILVDGRRDAQSLAALVPQQCDSLLGDLVSGGFIEAAPETTPPLAAPAAPRPVARDSSMPARAAADALATASSATFETLRRSAVRAFSDEVGPAGDNLAVRMERTHDFEELRPLLALAAQMVAGMRGRQAGEVYGMRFLASGQAA